MLVTLGAVVQAALLSRLLAEVFLGRKPLAELSSLLAGLVALGAVRGLSLIAVELLGQKAAGQIKLAVRRQLDAKLLELGPLALATRRTGDLASLFGEGTEALSSYVGQALPQLVLSVLAPALILVIYAVLDPLSALALLVIAPFIPVLMSLIGLKTRELMDRRWAELARMSAHFLDMLQGLPTLKLFGQSRAQVAGIEQVSRRYGRSTMDVLRVALQSSLVLDLAATMGVALVAIEVGSRLLLRSLPFERALLLLLLAPEFFLPLRQLALARHARLAAVAAASRVFAVLDMPAPTCNLPPPKPAALLGLDVRLEGVAYTPPTRDEAALHEVTLRLPPGCMTALVGPTGAGKSLVAALLLCFAEPERGTISVGGEALCELDPVAWRRLIAWMPQRPHLFHGSIADNIRLGKPEAGVEEVRLAARAAGADDFIQASRLGYATPVGEGGARLSGGQRRRIALARAFLLDRPIMVLDEPTAHLDRGTAASVRQAIASRCGGRTALVITHDLELARQADQVVTLEAGRVASGVRVN